MTALATEARHRIKARATRFDLATTPLLWVPGHPHAALALNTTHVVLPPGERWFADVFRDALEFVDDDDLRADVQGFVGQELTHAKAHDRGLDYLAREGIDLARAVALADATVARFDRLVRRLPRRLRRLVLVVELAAIAGIEHHTTILGKWILEAGALDEVAADPQMVDLLRWHGAEEVEHRHVAYDLYQHVSGSYMVRASAGLLVAAVLYPALMALAVVMSYWPGARAKGFRPRDHRAAVAAGVLPSARWVTGSVRHYLGRGHHPRQLGSLDQALTYLATSPGVVHRAGRPTLR